MVKRFPHYLKGTKRTAVPFLNIFVDTESHCEKDFVTNGKGEINPIELQHFRLGWVCFQDRLEKIEEWQEIMEKEQFWDLFFKRLSQSGKHELVVWAHNMDYDFQNLSGGAYLCAREGVEITTLISEGMRFVLIGEWRGHCFKFLSTTNFFAASLAKLGDTIGLPKLDKDSTVPGWLEKDIRKVSAYCKRDVEILKAIVDNFYHFWLEHDMGTFKNTAASAAMGAFKHRFMDGKSIFVHDDKEILALEFSSYRGGRTECFRIGYVEPEGGVYVNDYNSMYPAIMHKMIYPVKFKRFYNDRPSPALLNWLMSKFLLIADVTIATKVPCVGIKRIINKSEKLVFPIGTFRACITSPEIMQVLRHGGKIVNVHSIACYEGQRLFESYINFFYELRLRYKKQKNGVMQECCKLFMNSLYGKFAQHVPEFEKAWAADKREFHIEMPYDAETGELCYFKTYGGWTYRKVGEQVGFDSFPAIASFATAYARCRLFDALMLVGFENLYYCDTDSIMTNQVGYARLVTNGYIDDHELGKLKLEDQARAIEIRALKDYTLFNSSKHGSDFRKLKGVRAKAKKLAPDLDGLERYEQPQFAKLMANMRDYHYDGVVVKQIVKKLHRKYDKGRVNPQGVVLPLVFSENP